MPYDVWGHRQFRTKPIAPEQASRIEDMAFFGLETGRSYHTIKGIPRSQGIFALGDFEHPRPGRHCDSRSTRKTPSNVGCEDRVCRCHL
jgi:hypothetical protein